MARSWNYTQMSMAAATYGGPEKYVDTILEFGIQQGLIQGKRIKTAKGIIIFLCGSALTVAVMQIPKAVHYIREKSTKKEITEPEYQEARDYLVKSLLKKEIDLSDTQLESTDIIDKADDDNSDTQ